MPRTALPVQSVVRAGVNPAYTAANVDGHSIANGNTDMVIHVKNGSGGSINVTFITPATIAGLAISDLIVAVPAGEERLIGPFPANPFNQADSSLWVDFSAVTTVTCAAFRVP